jgi:two-component system, LytTR family, sensor kinase
VPLKSKHITIALHATIWTMLLLLPYFVSNPHNGYKVGNMPWLFFTLNQLVNVAIFYFNAFYLFPQFVNKRRWLFYLLSVILLIACCWEIRMLIQQLFFPVVSKEFTTARFLMAPSIGILVVSSIYRLILDRIRLEREQKERQAAQLATELKFLRSQISPHFLFNVLTNLVSLARKQSDQLEPALIMLSELMRYMLYDTQGRKVPLGTEIGYLESYIKLQKLRFGNDIDISSAIVAGEQDRTCVIEPMLLIPFVENAFKHGVSFHDRPRINIRLSIKQGWMNFEVVNTTGEGVLYGDKEEGSGLGLNNVVSRLNLLYQGLHTLNIRHENNLFHIHLSLKLV